MEWLLLVFFSAVARAVDYSDLQMMGVACSPRDTCQVNRNRHFPGTNCECDSLCHSFDDCCVDAPNAGIRDRMLSRLGITCVPFDQHEGVYAFGKCRSSWSSSTGSDVVRRKCESPDDFSDPLMSLPAVDMHTNVTYKNHYCAECNYASLSNLTSWSPRLTCSSLEKINTDYGNITQDFIVRSITRAGSSWGVYHWNNTLHGMAFYPCEVSFHLPDRIKPHVRYCRPHAISTCVSNWNRNVVRSKCEEYMAVIYIGDQAYRNAHCALCNRVSIRNRTCDALGVTDRKRPSLSFTIIVDANWSDGNDVGEINSCSSGEIYDSFFKICRRRVCALPGHVIRGGRCVPQ